jgi:hypothetical protein
MGPDGTEVPLGEYVVVRKLHFDQLSEVVHQARVAAPILEAAIAPNSTTRSTEVLGVVRELKKSLDLLTQTEAHMGALSEGTGASAADSEDHPS